MTYFNPVHTHNCLTLLLLQKGEFKHISSDMDLRNQLGSYYGYFASTDNNDTPVVTVPYVDFAQLGKHGSYRTLLYKDAMM